MWGAWYVVHSWSHCITSSPCCFRVDAYITWHFCLIPKKPNDCSTTTDVWRNISFANLRMDIRKWWLNRGWMFHLALLFVYIPILFRCFYNFFVHNKNQTVISIPNEGLIPIPNARLLWPHKLKLKVKYEITVNRVNLLSQLSNCISLSTSVVSMGPQFVL